MNGRVWNHHVRPARGIGHGEIELLEAADAPRMLPPFDAR
jgi:hypothetical protein